MALYLDHVEVLSLDYTPQFLGDLTRFSTEKRATVRGRVLNLTNSQGISGIWSGVAAINQNQDYDEIVLNGTSFGRGKISNTSFNEGTDVRQKSYTTDITVYESGNLFNITNGNYNNATILEPTFLQNLDESLSYTKSENGQSNYNHSVAVTYRSGFQASGSQISLAQQLASGLFNANNLTGLLGLYDHGYKKIYNENYNYISNECNFSLSYNFFREASDYSIEYNHVSEINENGIVNVTEEGNISRIVGTSIDGTYDRLETEIVNSLSRCQAIKTAYFSAGDSLSTIPIERAATINNFSNSIEYSVTYTNDPAIQDRYSWQYTTTLDKNQDGITIISEQGTVLGFGRVNIDKYTNAERGFLIIKPDIQSRLQTYYNKTLPNFESIWPLNKKLSLNRWNGLIEYSHTYSDDLTLRAGEVRKIEVLKDISYPTRLSNTFNILKFKEIIQPTKNATVGVQTTTVTLWGNRNLPLRTFLNRAKNEIENPDGDDKFLAGANYTFDPFLSQFILTVTQNFHGSKAFDSNTVNLS